MTPARLPLSRTLRFAPQGRAGRRRAEVPPRLQPTQPWELGIRGAVSLGNSTDSERLHRGPTFPSPPRKPRASCAPRAKGRARGSPAPPVPRLSLPVTLPSPPRGPTPALTCLSPPPAPTCANSRRGQLTLAAGAQDGGVGVGSVWFRKRPLIPERQGLGPTRFVVPSPAHRHTEEPPRPRALDRGRETLDPRPVPVSACRAGTAPVPQARPLQPGVNLLILVAENLNSPAAS